MEMKYSKHMLIAAAALTLGAGAGVVLESNIDTKHRFAWGENIGWMAWGHDAADAGFGVRVEDSYLSSLAWAQNVGWINFGNGTPSDGVHWANDMSDSSTFGVNFDPVSGDLSGKAWGENIGWINFDTAESLTPFGQQARLDVCEGRFRGYAWGENVGWINLGDATHHVTVVGCRPGDVTCNDLITLADYAALQARLAGPGVSVVCPTLDSDSDNDLDLRDFGSMQVAFSGN